MYKWHNWTVLLWIIFYSVSSLLSNSVPSRIPPSSLIRLELLSNSNPFPFLFSPPFYTIRLLMSVSLFKFLHSESSSSFDSDLTSSNMFVLHHSWQKFDEVDLVMMGIRSCDDENLIRWFIIMINQILWWSMWWWWESDLVISKT